MVSRSSEKPKICLHIVDNSRRDLEWRLVLADKLAQKGIVSYLGDASAIRAKLHSMYDVVLCGRLGSTTGRSDFDKSLLSLLEARNGKVIFFHDEGAIYLRNDYERMVRHIYPGNLFARKSFEKIFFWGEKQFEVFKDQEWISKSEVIGMPRLSFSPRTNRRAVLYGYEDKEFILINSRFGDVNKPDGDIPFFSERRIDIRAEGGSGLYSRRDLQTQLLKEWYASSSDFSNFILMILECAKRFPKTFFIVRPHPSESTSFYNEAFSSFENIVVSKDGDVSQLLRGAKCVIHSQCSTALEAALMGTLAINFIPNQSNSFALAAVDEIEPIARTIDDVLSILGDVIKHGSEYVAPDSLNFIDKRYIKNVDNPASAMEKITDAVVSCFDSSVCLSDELRNCNAGVLASFNRYNINQALKSIREFVFPIGNDSRLYWPDKLTIHSFVENEGLVSKVKCGYRVVSVHPS